jgi:excinuclease ABC subunit C
VRVFDRKFGSRFLAGIPHRPGVYRLYDAAGTLLYVGKARDLRRRLAQYRTARRIKKDRKRRELVRSAMSIAWDVCESELEASLLEIRLIHTLRPRENVAGAFPFLYPFIGIRVDGRETYLCLTTSPEALPAFDFHGAFRSRDVTGEAFFSVRRLLCFVGHPIPRRRCDGLGTAPHSYVFGVRRLPERWPEMWRRLLRGVSREALEHLSLRLLEHAGARARSAEVQEGLRAIGRFFEGEARELAMAIAATGYSGYPVPQRHRDLLFLRYRRQGGLEAGGDHHGGDTAGQSRGRASRV